MIMPKEKEDRPAFLVDDELIEAAKKADEVFKREEEELNSCKCLNNAKNFT